jgi:hypothetical protein
MSDEELRRYGRAAAWMADPVTQRGQVLETYRVQLAEGGRNGAGAIPKEYCPLSSNKKSLQSVFAYRTQPGAALRCAVRSGEDGLRPKPPPYGLRRVRYGPSRPEAKQAIGLFLAVDPSPANVIVVLITARFACAMISVLSRLSESRNG